MKLTLPGTVASPQDLAALTSDVHAYSAWTSRQLIKQKVSTTVSVPQPVLSKDADLVIQAWSGGKPLSQKGIDELLVALDRYKRSAPTVTVTLAALPSGELKATLVAWFRKEIRPEVLVTFRSNRQIIGGMVVASGSRIHDWSYRRALLSHETRFHEVLARV